MTALATVGHGSADRTTLVDLLRGAQITRVVDVRRYPYSRHNEDVRIDALRDWLPAAGIDYRWDERLGGRRGKGDAGPDQATGGDLDPWWRVASFRAYAAYTRTEPFRAAMTDLLAALTTNTGTTAVMCSESLWWRCHRRLIADVAVLLHGVEVAHLGHRGELGAHRPSAGARVTADGLRYDRTGPVAADG